MRLGELLALENALVPYIKHLRLWGNPADLKDAERVFTRVHAEAIRLECAAYHVDIVADNDRLCADLLEPI